MKGSVNLILENSILECYIENIGENKIEIYSENNFE